VPYTWASFPTASVPAIRGVPPGDVCEYVRRVADEEELGRERVVAIYFETGREVAHAIFKDIPGSQATKRIARRLGSTKVTKLLDCVQADEALGDLPVPGEEPRRLTEPEA
jgi:hypothetical protein